MAKNIALFLDGTRNGDLGSGNPKNTNVQKLHDAADRSSQVTKYLNGVGADESLISPNFYLGPYGGLGVAQRIRESYQFLARNYQPGDSIFLFGFSRGAFAARSLAGFVHRVGILFRDKVDENLEKAYGLYVRGPDGHHSELSSFLQHIPDISDDLNTLGFAYEPIQIYFIGAWDTVAALGPQVARKLNHFLSAHHRIELPPNVQHARHALSVHETRERFKPSLWSGCSKEGQTLKQVWFPGGHADVGGGYKSCGLSNFALEWMAEEAVQKSLLLRKLPVAESVEVTKKFHQEDKGVWRFVPRSTRKELAVIHELDRQPARSFYVHQSVCQHLLNRSARQYQFTRRTNAKLIEADELSLQLFLGLSFIHKKVPIGREHAPVKGSCGPEGAQDVASGSYERAWWTAVTVDEVSQCESAVRTFIRAPFGITKDDIPVFARALCLFLLCTSEKDGESLVDETKRLCDDLLLQVGQQAASQYWSGDPARRLDSIAIGVDDASKLLPPQWNAASKTMTQTLHDQSGVLWTKIRQHNLKLGARVDPIRRR